MDTNQPSNTLSRRKFVKIGATGAATLFILPALSGCGSENSEAQTDEAEGGAGAQQKTATLAFRGGTIQTMTSENDVAEALAVDGNEIVYVGDEAGLEAFAGSGTKVIDLEGGMVVTGFMDGHIHAPGDWVTKLYDIYLGDATTVDEYVKIISDFVAAHPEREAYTGNPFMVNAFQLEDGSNPGPNKKLLDEICPDKPILLLDVSHHSAWVNSKALEMANITRDTPDPLGGIITRDENGEPTGYLIDGAATEVSALVVSEHTDEEYEQAIAKYQEDASRFGLTGITNLSAVDARFFSELEGGELNLRMRILPTIIPGTDPSEAVKTVKGLARYDSEMISTGTAKMFSDGVTEGGSAVMLEPYNEAAGKGSDWYGESEWDQQEFDAMVAALDKAGVQVHVHAIGDGAVRNTLNAFENAIKENGERADRRLHHDPCVRRGRGHRKRHRPRRPARCSSWTYRDPLVSSIDTEKSAWSRHWKPRWIVSWSAHGRVTLFAAGGDRGRRQQPLSRRRGHRYASLARASHHAVPGPGSLHEERRVRELHGGPRGNHRGREEGRPRGARPEHPDLRPEEDLRQHRALHDLRRPHRARGLAPRRRRQERYQQSDGERQSRRASAVRRPRKRDTDEELHYTGRSFAKTASRGDPMPRETMTAKRQRALAVAERMNEHYPAAECALHYWGDPFRLTIAVLLSAQTTDKGVNKVTPALWERYPTPADLAAADVRDVEGIIRTIGFFHTKAANVIKCAQMVVADYGGEIPRDIDELQKLPGVGRKTANVVLNEAFGIVEGIAVDTHVFRIAHRLKFAGPSADTPAKTEAALLKLYPREYWGPINHQWVLFGRERCIARNPKCATCFLCDLCPSCGKA